MPMEHGPDLMQALVAKLYAILTGDDEAIKVPRNKFISWFLPGVPFAPADFRYCAKGFNATTAEAVGENYHQAFVLSKLFDYIPDVSNEFIEQGMQQTLFASSQDSISSVYKDVLNHSRVRHKELSDKEKQKLQKFRDLLSVEVEERNLVTDEVTTVSRPGKLTIAYNDKMKEYLEAAEEYLNAKIDAISATGQDAEAKRRVHRWAQGEKFLRSKLDAAEMAWVSQGYKKEYEEINAYIDQVTRQSLVLYKQDLIRKFDRSLLNSPSDGDFFYTTLLPGHFATSTGWTRFTFYEGDYEAHSNKKTSAWSGSAGASFGLFSVGGSAGSSKQQMSEDQKSKNFSASFEFTQVPICRPWFEPGFFAMRAWTLDDTWNLNYDKKPVSDGAAKPAGRLVAYPVSALFVRNVSMSASGMSRHSEFVKKATQAGGRVGYGPFHVGGSYSAGSEKRDSEAHIQGDSLTIDGLQLIGFINNIIPKAPNTNPDIPANEFVGGS